VRFDEKVWGLDFLRIIAVSAADAQQVAYDVLRRGGWSARVIEVKELTVS
jgi:hypothetical protein